MRRRAGAVLGLLSGTLLISPPSSASDCDAGAQSVGSVYVAEMACTTDHTTDGADNAESISSSSYYTAYRDRPVCFIRSYWGNQSGGCPASAPDTCKPGETLYEQQGLHNGQWESLGQFCRNDTPGAVNPPQVTPADVARAFQRIPLPALRAKTQPADKTLINFDTIFYVEAAPLHRTLTLLGQRVELEITPSRFRWVHGDGTTAETTTPGAAYPAKDVVYRYQQAHVTVEHHVEVVWTARWSLNGGPYQDVAGTVTTVGPDTPLRVAEATPALSGYGH